MTFLHLRNRMNRISATALIALFLLPALAAAQVNTLRQDVIIDAETTGYDGKLSMLQFTGLRLTQGGTSIAADIAHASELDFDDSVWRFSGNVAFDTDLGSIRCDSADLTFSNFELQVATIEGSPATVEFKRDDSDEVSRASANKLHYNVAKGIMEFSGDAEFSEGGNRIASQTIVYNIHEQRFYAASSGSGDDRVKVTFTPPDDGAGELKPPDDSAVPEDGADVPDEQP